LIRCLYRQASHRWFILMIALAFLVWLGLYAGRVRNPDAVKRGWAVLTSRVLAVAAGFILIRLLLFSYEERVPVLLFDLRCSRGGSGVLKTIGDTIRRLEDHGYEIVPLDDVVEFVRERRYVPRKCMGVVLEAGAMEDLRRIADHFRETEVTVLLPPEAFETSLDQADRFGVPTTISLGLSLVEARDLADTARLKSLLEHYGAKAAGPIDQLPKYVRVHPSLDVGLRGLLKGTAYRCFLDGRGFNRFGDEGHLLRLFDTTALLDSRPSIASLALYMGLFKGKYYLWPAAAVLRLCRAGPEGI
jgi:hypothetical protein